MKLITAIVKPFKLDEVREALADVGVAGLTVTDVKGFGRQKGQIVEREDVFFERYVAEFVPKIKLEIVVPDKLVKRVVKVILSSAKTNNIGDGKIFILPIEDAIRIRTGERGEDAVA